LLPLPAAAEPFDCRIWRVKRAAAGEPECVGNHLIGLTRAEIKLKLAMQA
jgi:hypothetical protein